MELIKTTAGLKAFCTKIENSPFVTVDTEFMREKTYYSQLCLVQVANERDAALIDPLADGMDLEPLLELMRDPKVMKVFHAARQDLEIFYRLMNEVPKNLYDSQIAAMACGYGDQVGYEPLVKATTGAQVDKGSRFTDWSKRPLSDKQMAYALADVTHLVDVYKVLTKELEADGRDKWVAEELEALNDPALYHTKPEEAWRRLKLRNVRPKELGPIIKVAEWREKAAQHKDLPRARVLKDDAILEVARAKPSSREELAGLRAIPQGFERSRSAEALLTAIADGVAIPYDDLPSMEKSRSKTPPPADVLDLLRVLLKRQSDLHRVAPKLLASASDLEAIAISDEADVPALRGWRREVFGDIALRLKNGAVSMSLDKGKVKLIDLSNQ